MTRRDSPAAEAQRNRYHARREARLCVVCAAGLQEHDTIRCIECEERKATYEESPDAADRRRARAADFCAHRVQALGEVDDFRLTGGVAEDGRDRVRATVEEPGAWLDLDVEDRLGTVGPVGFGLVEDRDLAARLNVHNRDMPSVVIDARPPPEMLAEAIAHLSGCRLLVLDGGDFLPTLPVAIVDQRRQTFARGQSASVDLRRERIIDCPQSRVDAQHQRHRVALAATTGTPDVEAEQPRVVPGVANRQVHATPDGA